MSSAINIDILMPVYNEQTHIKEAVLSILNFDYGADIWVTLIVVDDQSTDNTLAILSNLEYSGKNVTLIIDVNKSKGKNSAFNVAFDISKSDYVCFMGGDDLLRPEVLVERARALLQSHSLLGQCEPAASFCKLRMFSDVPKYNDIVIPKNKFLGSLSGGGVMINRILAKNIFPIPVDLPNEDNWFGLHIEYMPCKKYHVPKVGLDYRIHSGNSHVRDGDFVKYREMIWSRAKANMIFYVRFGAELSANSERRLLINIAVAISKYIGWWAICVVGTGIGLRDRLRIFTQSTRFGFKLRTVFFQYFTGR